MDGDRSNIWIEEEEGSNYLLESLLKECGYYWTGFRGCIRVFPGGVIRMGCSKQEDYLMQRGHVTAIAGHIWARAWEFGILPTCQSGGLGEILLWETSCPSVSPVQDTDCDRVSGDHTVRQDDVIWVTSGSDIFFTNASQLKLTHLPKRLGHRRHLLKYQVVFKLLSPLQHTFSHS